MFGVNLKNMAYLGAIVWGFIAGYSPLLAIEPAALPPLSSLTTENARKHLSVLASDAMMGRDTPSPELERSAEYIAGEFKKFGVKPVKGSYFHTYTLQRVRLVENNVLKLRSATKDSVIEFAIKDDYVPVEYTGAGTIRKAKLVFVGFGMTSPEVNYDDYAGIDVRGKVVVMLRGAPRFSDSVIKDTNLRSVLWKNARSTAKAKVARERGAIGCLIISDPVRTLVLKAVGFPWPLLYPKLPVDALPLRAASVKDTMFPMLHVGENVVNALFGSKSNLTDIQKNIENSGLPHSFSIDTVTTEELTVTTVAEKVQVRNVVGIVEGTNKSGEHIVIGAHYDHVGYEHPNDPTKDSIYNGADDNASGTTGLLLLAESLAATKPVRSVMFIAFSGEEKGLLGSKAYCESPLLPLSSCKAMFNMDMIGRNNEDSLSLGGNTRCKELSMVAEEENKLLIKPFALAYNIEHFFFRSDQASFAMKKIPVLFFFSGEHADYHKQADQIEKINFGKLVRITELCGRCVWRTANTTVEFPFTPQKGDTLTE